jgi:hypothetical protein
MTTPKLNDGKWIRDETIVLQNGNITIKEYQNVIYEDLNNDMDKYDPKMIIKKLNPRVYQHQSVQYWNTFYHTPITMFINPQTKERIELLKDYDTTPKRKIEKNKIWSVNPQAVNYISAFGYIDYQHYKENREKEYKDKMNKK